MCGRMFPDESDEVEKYVGGLPDIIRGNVMSYRPKTLEEAIEFANDQMDQKVLTISERQAEQKRKLEFNAGNNQGYQQLPKRQSVAQAYAVETGERKEYARTLPLCNKCKYRYIKNHKKTVKNGQARTRERKSIQKPEAKARKILSKQSLAHSHDQATSEQGKHTWNGVLYYFYLEKKHKSKMKEESRVRIEGLEMDSGDLEASSAAIKRPHHHTHTYLLF
ncbi:hypothetical protein Tco_1355989 [Tanacetum coccineum]